MLLNLTRLLLFTILLELTRAIKIKTWIDSKNPLSLNKNIIVNNFDAKKISVQVALRFASYQILHFKAGK